MGPALDRCFDCDCCGGSSSSSLDRCLGRLSACLFCCCGRSRRRRAVYAYENGEQEEVEDQMNLPSTRIGLPNDEGSVLQGGPEIGRGTSKVSVGIGDIIAKGQGDFCEQCVQVAIELLDKGVLLQKEEVEAVDPQFVLGIAAVVTFRFIVRSSEFDNKFVFKDGCEIRDTALPAWHPLVYLFFRRLRGLRSKMRSCVPSQEERRYVEAMLMGRESQTSGSLDQQRLDVLHDIVTDINSVAIEISQQSFYKNHLGSVAKDILAKANGLDGQPLYRCFTD